MKKTLLFFIGLALVLTLGTTVATATPVEALTELAGFFPAETAFFFSIRTDDAFIDELDELVGTLRETLPPGSIPPVTLRDALDRAISEQYGDDATFDNTIRSWLGDTAAFGVLSLDVVFDDDRRNDNELPVLFAIDITDREAAEAFFERVIAESGREGVTSERSGYTTYTSKIDNAYWAIGDDVILLATTQDALNLSGDFISLTDNADFEMVTGLLPAESYHAALVINAGDAFATMFSQALVELEEADEDVALLESLMPIYENYPTQAIGFTILDGTSLTMDFAQTPFDYSLLEGTMLGGVTDMVTVPEAIDTTFAQYIPEDVPFFIQGSNFGTSLDLMIEAIAIGMELGIQQEIAEGSFDEDVPAFVRNLDANDIRAFVDLGFAGFTGLNLRDDVLAHLNGNAAFYGRFLPSESLPMTFDAALVFEVTDADATQNIVDSLTNALDRYEVSYAAGDGIIELPQLIRGLFPVDMADALTDPQLDFLIGLSDTVFAMGTRPGVEFSLAPTSDNLADDDAYAAAQEHFLSGAQSVVYLNFDPLRQLVEMAGTMGGSSAAREAEQVGLVLSLFESASVTGFVNEDFSSVSRFVLTLAD